jgi:hypothetical protein
MGFLDQKERIIDLKLTEKGRKLLSKGLLDFKFFAFSDEGIDYQLSSSMGLSGSLDDYIHRNLSFEADQRKNELDQPVNNSLNTFLYTIESGAKILPKFLTSHSSSQGLSIDKYYYNINPSEIPTSTKDREKIDVITKVIRTKKPSRNIRYLIDQFSEKVQSALAKNKSVVGEILTTEYVVLDRLRALNIVTGFIESVKKVRDIGVSAFSKNVEVITGLEEEEVFLRLGSGDGQVSAKDGFLVEVFESGSDGSLRKVNRKRVKSITSDKEVKYGFESYLNLESDSGLDKSYNRQRKEDIVENYNFFDEKKE